MRKVDAIVIGSGPSGAVTGAYLARGGLKIVVFESDAGIGGPRYGAYDFQGHHIDRMCHIPIWYTAYNDGFGWWPKAVKETGAIVRAQFMPNTGICLPDGRMEPVPYCLNGATMADYIASFAPMELTASTLKELTRTFDEILAMPKELVFSMEMECMPFKEWLDGVTDDPVVKRLLAVLAAVIFVASADVVLENSSVASIVGGVFQGLIGGHANMTMIVGDGCDGLPKGFCNVVLKHGGEVLTNHVVTRVLIEEGRAKGVVVRNVKQEELFYEAPHIILASHYASIRQLIPREMIPASIDQTIDRYMGIYHSTGIDVDFIMRDQFASMRYSQIIVMSGEGSALDYRGAILMPSYYEPRLSPPGKQVIKAEKIVPVKEVEKKGDDFWREEATEMVNQAFPGFKHHVEAVHVGRATPVIHFSFIPGPKVPLFFPGVMGLYIVGDYTNAPGIATERAASSAMRVAKTILRREGRGFLVGTA